MTLKPVAVAALLLVPVLASAADTTGKSYVYGSIGQSRQDLSELEDSYQAALSGFNAIPGFVTGTDMEDTTTSFAIGGGYQINANLAVEMFYRSYGEAAVEAGATDGADFIYAETEVSTSALGVSLLGMVPVADNFALFARLDAASLTVETRDEVISTLVAGFTAKDDDTNTRLGFGIGGQLNLDNGISFRAEAQRIEAEYGEEEFDIDTVSLSLMKSF